MRFNLITYWDMWAWINQLLCWHTGYASNQLHSWLCDTRFNLDSEMWIKFKRNIVQIVQGIRKRENPMIVEKFVSFLF